MSLDSVLDIYDIHTIHIWHTHYPATSSVRWTYMTYIMSLDSVLDIYDIHGHIWHTSSNALCVCDDMYALDSVHTDIIDIVRLALSLSLSLSFSISLSLSLSLTLSFTRLNIKALTLNPHTHTHNHTHVCVLCVCDIYDIHRLTRCACVTICMRAR